jgi:iron complex outermembrane receptor protein
MDHLTLSVSGTYVDAKTTTRFCESTETLTVTSTCGEDTLVAPSGTKLPVTPDFKGNATARYTFQAGNYDSFVQAAVFHQGSTTFGLEEVHNEHVGDTPAFTTLDLSGGFGQNNWKLEAFIQNVTDERGQLGRFSQCNDGIYYCNDHARVYPVKPQFFGIKFGQSF